MGRCCWMFFSCAVASGNSGGVILMWDKSRQTPFVFHYQTSLFEFSWLEVRLDAMVVEDFHAALVGLKLVRDCSSVASAIVFFKLDLRWYYFVSSCTLLMNRVSSFER
ncbi:hypothetical protein V6N11_033826 [Hibiscus sabdariffa]|uniref:Uncharacterized protein n=1 Tax=Hibiscus sabdariffa TaxID=183260 RepID=A0ABR2S0U7_9ROSI